MRNLVFSCSRAGAPIFGAIRSTWEGGLRRLARPVTSWFSYLFWSVIRWAAGLNLRLLLQGLPALVIGLASAFVLAFAAFTPSQDIERQYWERAQAATRAKNFTEAIACYERLAYLQSDRSDVLFEMALNAEAAEQPERCKALMNRLASPDQQGYAKAHLWQAVKLMTAPQQPLNWRQIAESHLLKAIDGGVEDKEAAHGLLGELYFARSLFDQAETHLAIAVKTKPNARLRLAQTYAALGYTDRARAEAKLSVNYYRTAAKADLFAHFARFRWAESVTFLEDFPQAVAILEEGLTGTGVPVYHQQLAWVYAHWYQTLTQKAAPVSQRLALLEMGLRHDPKNLNLLNHLSAVTRMRHTFRVTPELAASTWGFAGLLSPWEPICLWGASGASEADIARAALRRMLAQGQGSAQLHFALGVDAWGRGEVKEAAFHWDRANQLSPDIPVVANNLAWLMLQSSPQELPKALQLIDKAIEKSPQETNFRDTRGQILFKMGRFKEALPDLEAALAQSQNRAGLHRTLAEVYSKLERPELVDEHRRLEQEELAKMKSKTK
jgi:tetratricopeptide (TPR) repeat protein